ncbi:MAG: hypothetical protein QM817_03165 [Archangium sp.]
MKAINCPQCGAPANIQDTQQAVYTCPFCNRSFDTGNAPPAVERDDAPIPQIIVVAPGGGESSRRSGGGGGSAIIGSIVMFVLIGGFTLYMLRSAGVPMKDVKSTMLGKPDWDGKSAFECSGNEDLTVENIDTTLPGTAVITDGNCHVKFVNCHFKADTVFELSGNSQIRLEGGTFEGETAIDASGNSVVRIAGATVTGKRKHRANARIDGK